MPGRKSPSAVTLRALVRRLEGYEPDIPREIGRTLRAQQDRERREKLRAWQQGSRSLVRSLQRFRAANPHRHWEDYAHLGGRGRYARKHRARTGVPGWRRTGWHCTNGPGVCEEGGRREQSTDPCQRPQSAPRRASCKGVGAHGAAGAVPGGHTRNPHVPRDESAGGGPEGSGSTPGCSTTSTPKGGATPAVGSVRLAGGGNNGTARRGGGVPGSARSRDCRVSRMST